MKAYHSLVHDWTSQAKPWIEKRKKSLAFAVAGVLLICVLLGVYTQSSSSAREAAFQYLPSAISAQVGSNPVQGTTHGSAPVASLEALQDPQTASILESSGIQQEKTFPLTEQRRLRNRRDQGRDLDRGRDRSITSMKKARMQARAVDAHLYGQAPPIDPRSRATHRRPKGPATSDSTGFHAVANDDLVSLIEQRKHSNAQEQEDLALLKAVFHDRKAPGFFVEFGARDGKEHSLSWLFSTYLGWKGILADADDQQSYNLNVQRPESITVRGIICEHGEEKVFGVSRIGGWSGLVDKYSDDRKDKLTGSHALRCHGLKQLLDFAGVNHVNFMVVDTEGSELHALKTFPWERIHVDVVTVETLIILSELEKGRQNQAEIIEYMKSVHYKLVKNYTISSDTVNFWFQPDFTYVEPAILFDPAKFESARRYFLVHKDMEDPHDDFFAATKQ